MMTLKKLKNYSEGKDCECYAYNPDECGCGADWTPKERYIAQLLLNYTHHYSHCNFMKNIEKKCSCGLDELKQTLREK